MPHDELASMYRRAQGQPVDDELSAIFWWRYEKSDCNNYDISTKCSGDVAECKALCEKTNGCYGFNTHGFMKNKDCSGHIAPESSVDLYLLKDRAQQPSWPFIWPHPKQYTNGTTRLWLDANRWAWKGTVSSELNAAFERYAKLTFPRQQTATSIPAPVASTVVVTVADTAAALQLGVDESYKLAVPSDGSAVTIAAQTVYGALHALETFSQLVEFDFDVGAYYVDAAPWIVIDAPRFAHREVLLDSSRHFLPIPVLKQVIDALAYTKINTVHWHWVDDQSFPLELPSFPQFARTSSYGTPTEHYSVADAREIVEYARMRGVRIVPEMDMPGHASSWCAGEPSMCPSATCRSPLNVARQSTFDTIAAMQKDLTTVFPDRMLHLGGDEVDTSCWTKTPEVKAWLDQHNMTAQQAYLYFEKQVHKSARDVGRDVIGWEEIWRFFGTDLDKSTIIHQWLPLSNIAANATAHGYRVLISTSSSWYLDWLTVTWKQMYAVEPCKGIDDKLCDSLVLGGGGEMWGETVDASNIQATIFPRLAAIAERLWSPRTITDVDVAEPRYAHFRCLLNSRGVGAAPHANAVARSAPSGPGSCRQ